MTDRHRENVVTIPAWLLWLMVGVIVINALVWGLIVVRNS